MFNELKNITYKAKKELNFYKMLIKHSKTPLISKIFLGSAVLYLLLPFDLIPDFIPIIGVVDDIIIVPLLIIIGLKFINKEVMKELKDTFIGMENNDKRTF